MYHDSAEYNYFGGAVSLQQDTEIIAQGGNFLTSHENKTQSSVSIYHLEDDQSWSLNQRLYDSHPLSSFGSSIAFDGNTFIVGARSYSEIRNPFSQNGTVYIYNFNDVDDWEISNKLHPQEEWNTFFGSTVALNGDRSDVSSNSKTHMFLNSRVSIDDPVYVYKFNNGIWNLEDSITFLSGFFVERLGTSISLNDHEIALSSITKSGTSLPNKVLIFNFENGQSSFKQRLPDHTEEELDGFGQHIEMTETDLVISSNEGKWHNEKTIYCYQKNDIGLWVLSQLITHQSNSSFSKFGESFYLDEDKLIISNASKFTFLQKPNQGELNYYVKIRDKWTLNRIVPIEELSSTESLGYNLSMSNGKIMVGMPQADFPLRDSGIVYFLDVEPLEFLFEGFFVY